MSQEVHFDVAFPKLTSSTSDIDSFCRLSDNDKTIIAKLDIILQGHVVSLSAKNGRDVRVTQWGEECVKESAAWRFWHNKLLHNHFPIIPSLLNKTQLTL